jgi:hypothetical protein
MSLSLRRFRAWAALALVLVLLALALAACGPEASRVDGDGKKSGADVGNWGDPVEMHGSESYTTSVYYKTPDEAPAPAK